MLNISPNNQVTISLITCPKGHKFYPKVLPDGTVNYPKKCLIRNCRIDLDRKKAEQGKKDRSKHLIHGQKPNIDLDKHPTCRICKITLFDKETLDKHNKRLH